MEHYLSKIIKFNQSRLLAMMSDRLNNGYATMPLTQEVVEELFPFKKELFVAYMELAKQYLQYSKSLTDEYGFEPYCYPSAELAYSTSQMCARMLFDDTNEIIQYFIYDLQFGAKWHEGALVDPDGNDVPLRNVDELWDAIILNIRHLLTDYYTNLVNPLL